MAHARRPYLEVPLRAHMGGPDAAYPWELGDGRGRAEAQKDLYSVPVALWTFVLLEREGPALAAIGRHLVPDRRAGDQQEAVEALAELAGLERAEVDAVAHAQRFRCALRKDPPGTVVPGSGAGSSRHRQREHRCRPRAEGPVVIEWNRRVEPRAGADLGHRPVRRGAVDRAGAAAVHELELCDLGERRDDLGPAVLHVPRGGGLHLPDDQVVDRLARHVVADPGDLSLVGDRSDEGGALAAVDLLGECDRLIRGPDRRAPLAEPDEASQPAPGEIDVDGDADRRHEGGPRLLDQVEVLDAVAGDHGRLLGILRGDPRE